VPAEEAVASASGGQVEARIRDFLRESFARELHMNAGDVRPESRFVDMGLDSITGVTWIQAVNRQYGVIITIKQLHDYPTVAELASFLASRAARQIPTDGAGEGPPAGRSARPSPEARTTARSLPPELVPLNDRKQGAPIFWIHAGLGGVEGYEVLARRLDRPFYGIQARGWTGDDEPVRGMGNMAAHYRQIVRSVQPEGPYELGGYSIGGMLAYELARQLQGEGARVAGLVMIDTLDTVGLRGVDLSARSELLEAINILLGAAHGHDARKLIHRTELPAELGEPALLERLIALARERGLSKPPEALRALVARMVRIQQGYEIGSFALAPLERPDEVDALYFRNQSGLFLGELGGYYSFAGERLPVDGTCYWSEWKRHLPRLRMVEIPSSSHMTMLLEPAAAEAIFAHCERLYGSRRSTGVVHPTVVVTSAGAG
jgi:polyketide synthase PksR